MWWRWVVMVDVEQKRVLVVDDCLEMADAIAMVLRMSGHDARTAYSGADAIVMAASFEPEVVILDIALPDISGYEVARQLRACHPNCFLVALIGYMRPSDGKRATDAGCDMHMGKPVGAKALQAVVRSSCLPTGARSRVVATCSTT